MILICSALKHEFFLTCFLFCSLNLHAHFVTNSQHLQNKVTSNPYSYLKGFKGRWSHLDNWLLHNTSQWFPDLVPKQYWQLVACYLRNSGYQALLFNSRWVISEKWKAEGEILLLGTISVSKQKGVFQTGLRTQPVSQTQCNPQGQVEKKIFAIEQETKKHWDQNAAFSKLR